MPLILAVIDSDLTKSPHRHLCRFVIQTFLKTEEDKIKMESNNKKYNIRTYKEVLESYNLVTLNE